MIKFVLLFVFLFICRAIYVYPDFFFLLFFLFLIIISLSINVVFLYQYIVRTAHTCDPVELYPDSGYEPYLLPSLLYLLLPALLYVLACIPPFGAPLLASDPYPVLLEKIKCVRSLRIRNHLDPGRISNNLCLFVTLQSSFHFSYIVQKKVKIKI